jgi:hypothetical protein
LGSICPDIYWGKCLGRGIIGEFAGATHVWKLNTYGLSWEKICYLTDTFKDIADKAEKYELQVKRGNHNDNTKLQVRNTCTPCRTET